MARPKKSGLDYFPKDVNFYSDRKVRRIMHQFGTKGAVIYDYLLCVIYEENGYYVQYDDHLAFDIADALGCGIKEELVKEVVEGCFRVGLFNKDLFDSSRILTSQGIQKRYSTAKRNPSIRDDLNLIDVKTGVFTAKTSINDAKSTQSKVKESKVKERERPRARIPVDNDGDLRAFEFLKTKYPSRFEQDFQMKFSKKIKDKEKFVADFNDKVDEEDLEYSAKKLFGRLGRFARNWCQNQDKFSTKNQDGSNQTNNIPIN